MLIYNSNQSGKSTPLHLVCISSIFSLSGFHNVFVVVVVVAASTISVRGFDVELPVEMDVSFFQSR